MARLDGKVIVVTGASGALGSAVVRAAEAAGARVARVDQATGRMSGDLVYEGVDLADEPATRRAFDDIAAKAGGIDGLANIAGGFLWSPNADSPAEVWERMFRINVLTAVTACRAALAHLTRRRGAIVNIGAGATARAAAGMGPYTASKSGVARLTESLAEELAEAGVRANAVLPSVIDTPANRKDMPKADFGSWVHPDDLAQTIVFLLSDEAAAISGASISVSHGRGKA